jgi:formylglycine-generating enzyme required for sulfatase activity
VRKLLRSKQSGSITIAIGLLRSTDRPSKSWAQVFTAAVLRKLISTWNCDVWNAVATGLRPHRSLSLLFRKTAVADFRRLSGNRQTAFLEEVLVSCGIELAPVIADIVSTLKLRDLSLAHVKCLSDAAADALSNFKGDHLDLSGLTSLSDEAAECLSAMRGNLMSVDLSGLSALSPAAARSFSRANWRSLDLGGLSSLPDAVAESLSKSGAAYLILNGVTQLSEVAAASLSKSKSCASIPGGLCLDGVKSLSRTAVQSFTRAMHTRSIDDMTGTLFLRGLKELSNESAMLLAECPTIETSSYVSQRAQLARDLGPKSKSSPKPSSSRTSCRSLSMQQTAGMQAMLKKVSLTNIRRVLSQLASSKATEADCETVLTQPVLEGLLRSWNRKAWAALGAFMAPYAGLFSQFKAIAEAAYDSCPNNDRDFSCLHHAMLPSARIKFLGEWSSSVNDRKPFIDLVAIPAGSFMMGSPVSEPGRGVDENQVRVRIRRPFSISRTVVTQQQWRDVIGTEPWLHEKGDFAAKLDKNSLGNDFPAVWLSWDDADLFCRTLTELERKTGRLNASQAYRLPTEAEWEYACRAGTTTAYSFGDSPYKLGDYGWYRDNSSSRLHKVAMKKPNPWGLHDMHGNVFEWCLDWYDTSLKGGDDPTGPARDPGYGINNMVMGIMPSRVMRGGNRSCRPPRCRSAHRSGWGNEGWRRDILVGLRVVCVTMSRKL